MLKNLNTKTVILASQSTRRQDLLSDLGITFEVITKPIEEDFPLEMNPHLIAEYLANKKSSAFYPKGEEIIITAEKYRSQSRNRELAKSKLVSLILKALKNPVYRLKTRPSKLVKVRRSDEKQRRSKIKAMRGRVRDDQN